MKLTQPHYRRILWRLSIDDHNQIKREAAAANMSINRFLTMRATGRDPGGYHAQRPKKEVHPLDKPASCLRESKMGDK
jgi:hypothetical protein